MPDAPVSSHLDVSASSFGSDLQAIMDADGLRPGDQPSYQLCKAIYIAHPLGAKMAEAPVRLAQSQEREVEVPDAPEEVAEAFQDQWKQLQATRYIMNQMTQARVYGICSVGTVCEGTPSDRPINLRELWKQDLTFNIFDPLNTAGSLVTSQNPNSSLFQKWGDLDVNGQRYHRSRTITVMNEEALYLAWSVSSFGFVGRSVYQRALYPLKSFLQSMRTDDMVTRKAGLLIAKMQSPGSIIDRTMKALFGVKRNLLREARTDNVLTIGVDEDIETLNLQNIDGASGAARNNIIKNIATAADMPAKLLTQEAYVEGFGEGTQDAYAVAQYVDRMRVEMQQLYDWWDTICIYRAWNEEFYKGIQRKYPGQYDNVPHLAAFYRWKNTFKAPWPSLIKEPPSEQAQVDDIRLKAVIAALQVIGPMLDPGNRVRLIQTVYDLFNTLDQIFGGAHFELDAETLIQFIESQGQGGDELAEEERTAQPPKPFAATDAQHDVAVIAEWLKSRPQIIRARRSRA